MQRGWPGVKAKSERRRVRPADSRLAQAREPRARIGDLGLERRVGVGAQAHELLVRVPRFRRQSKPLGQLALSLSASA